ncbi:MAG: hypothetical protein II237_01255, partial [Clostridia bacterium]|nr:hypothetical protein [Clostridia bacterium]
KLKGHTYTSEVTKEATHLEVGETTYTCACGDTYTEAIAKLIGHTYKEVVTKPTCTAKGYTTYTCECGDTYVDDYTDKLEHVYASEITTPATHLTEGIETFTCECGDSYRNPVAKLKGHTYTSEVTKEPTHLEEGVRTYTCECTHSYTESIPKLTKHTYVGTVTAPTCTTQGYTTYTCECGDSYVDDIVEARHTFSDEWTIDEDPTCKYEGVKSRHCEFCPARTDFAPVGKLTHDFVSVRVEPSCLDEGYIMSLCYNCGEEKTETIEPTGHDFDGSKCTVCDFDKADDCNCNCHKNGIPGLFWKIINFFNKLFRSKQYCSCGAKHW